MNKDHIEDLKAIAQNLDDAFGEDYCNKNPLAPIMVFQTMKITEALKNIEIEIQSQGENIAESLPQSV